MRMSRRGVIRLNRSSCLPVLLYFLIYFSKDTFLFGTNSNYAMTNIPIYVMVLFVAVELFYSIKRKHSGREKNILYFGIVFISIYIVLCMYHRELLQVAVIKFLCITSAMLLTMHYDFDEYAEAFSKVMVFNAIAAIILELIVYVLPSLAAALPRMTNTAGVQIVNIGIAGMASYELSATFVRAFGLLWEPGVFQIYLNLAIVYELFRQHAVNWRRIVILAIGVVLTFSTTGYIVLGVVVVSYVLLARKEDLSNNAKFAFYAFFIVAVAAFFLVDTSIVSQYVFGKLSNSESGSTIARQASIVVNFEIFKDHPWTGIGMRNIQDEYVRRSGLLFVRQSFHNTNTLLYQFAAHGIFYGALFLFGTYRMSYCFTKRKILQVAILVIIILLYVGENLRSSMLPYIIMFYGYGSLSRRLNTGESYD